MLGFRAVAGWWCCGGDGLDRNFGVKHQQTDIAEGEELPQASALINAAGNRLADDAAMARDDARQSVRK
ncbi:hypothetical protein [Catellatospora citrea]|uniref:Uncharacterized protein n=1 Tax=Catellatospora citrea TaxID=53366 RepID=A0A8J3KHL0_9ACTN|nr:hypothetical protein [Catellatospora citrea]GIG00830.1 hypothetical protein Cci01nite_59230 [Catellatospora citrea]